MGVNHGIFVGGENSLGYVAENVANKDASGGYVGLTLFKINFKNAANTFTSFLTNSNTAARTYTFQNRDGTIADDTDLALKANLASPTFTGTPAAPTASNGTNTTQLATCAFVLANSVSPSIGGTITGATAGSILFAATGPVFAQNNASLFWDDANTQLRLTAGAASKVPLKLVGAASQSGNFFETRDSSGNLLSRITSTGGIDLAGVSSGRITLYGGYTIDIGPGSLLYTSAGAHDFAVPVKATAFKVDSDTTAGNTTILVWDIDKGALARVSVGAADSGGAGFKVLRVPN